MRFRSPRPFLLLALTTLVGCKDKEDDQAGRSQTAAWKKAVEQGRPPQRAEAALELWNATREIRWLRELFQDAASTDLQKQRAAAIWLPRAKDVPEEAVDWVLRTHNGRELMAVLGALGPQGRKGLDRVRACLTEPDNGVRVTAIWALFRITGEPDEPVRLLLDELHKATVPGFKRTLADQLLGIGKARPERFEELLADVDSDAARELLVLHRRRRA